METAPVSVTAHVFGRVQGVGFRAWTQRQAMDLGLSGWVANERDGSVRAVFTGPQTAIDTMLERLNQGPRGAEVTSLVTEASDPAFSHTGFEVIA